MSGTSSPTRLAGVFLLGMGIPVIVSFWSFEILSLYFDAQSFSLLAAGGFAIGYWAFITSMDPDYIDAAGMAVVFPPAFVFAMGFVIIFSGVPEGLLYLFGDIEGLAFYSGVFMAGGLGTVALDRVVSRASRQHRRVPDPQPIAIGLIALLAVGTLAGAGVATASAMSTSVTEVEPGMTAPYSSAMLVTVDGPPSELRLTVTGPTGEEHTKRVSRHQMRDGHATIPVRWFRLGGPNAGTYRLRVTSLTGFTVDTTTYTLPKGPSPRILDIETARAGADMVLDLPRNATVYRPSPGRSDDRMRVAVIIKNEGDVAADFDTILHLSGDRVTGREIFIEPGQVGANIIDIPPENVTRLHEEAGGRVPIVVEVHDTEIRRSVTLPSQTNGSD